MTDLKVALIYFSATNVTHTYVRAIQDRLRELGCTAQAFDVTAYAARQKPLPLDEFDAFIFGFPVFADFAPSVINDWLPTLEGHGRKCALFLTYGARTTGYAHFHTRLLLEQAGFQVLFSAEFLGRHSFNVGGWRILPNRPDDQDLAVASEYAALACERFAHDSPEVFRLQKPFGYHRARAALDTAAKRTERAWTNPVRTTADCTMCRNCETECPTQAFNADTGLSDPARCIECMHCVYICPDHVLKVDDRLKDAYANFLDDWCLTDSMMAAKRSRIITDSWQAAF